MKNIICTFAVIMAVMSMLFVMVSCGNPTAPDTVLYSSTGSSPIELGYGDNYFDFSVEDAEGSKYDFHIHTDKTVVGEALEELGLIEGTEGDFGIYVNKVNGIYAEYEVTGTYWAFYVNGEYASAGIDMTEIVEGNTYTMKIEK